jgi:hypothetical protein
MMTSEVNLNSGIKDETLKNPWKFSISDVLKFTGPLNAFLLLFVLIFWIAIGYEQVSNVDKIFQKEQDQNKYFNDNLDLFSKFEDDTDNSKAIQPYFDGSNINEKLEINEDGSTGYSNALTTFNNPAVGPFCYFFNYNCPEGLTYIGGKRIYARQFRKVKYEDIIENKCRISREEAVDFVQERLFDVYWKRFRDRYFVDKLNEVDINDVEAYRNYKRCVSTIYKEHFEDKEANESFWQPVPPLFPGIAGSNKIWMCENADKNIDCRYRYFKID